MKMLASTPAANARCQAFSRVKMPQFQNGRHARVPGCWEKRLPPFSFACGEGARGAQACAQQGAEKSCQRRRRYNNIRLMRGEAEKAQRYSSQRPQRRPSAADGG